MFNNRWRQLHRVASSTFLPLSQKGKFSELWHAVRIRCSTQRPSCRVCRHYTCTRCEMNENNAAYNINSVMMCGLPSSPCKTSASSGPAVQKLEPLRTLPSHYCSFVFPSVSRCERLLRGRSDCRRCNSEHDTVDERPTFWTHVGDETSRERARKGESRGFIETTHLRSSRILSVHVPLSQSACLLSRRVSRRAQGY